MDFINNLRLNQKQKEYVTGLIEKLYNDFNADLYEHTISVLAYCGMLAEKYILNITDDPQPENPLNGSDSYYKLCISAIMHDYGKIFNFDELRGIALKNADQINAVESDFKINSLLHGFAGAFIVEKEFEIKDQEILDSIKYHTVGYCNMNTVDKIIYIADKLEERRNYKEVFYLRELSLKNINLCLLEVYKNNIIYIIKNNKNIYSETFKIWNNICIHYGGLLNGPGR
ncbi:MAG: bis(5'-nucleosyl)-tetraphosphatase (symmetrical) YqeK [Candidatus Humimicrobiaceae bacterium]